MGGAPVAAAPAAAGAPAASGRPGSGGRRCRGWRPRPERMERWADEHGRKNDTERSRVPTGSISIDTIG